MSAEAQVATRNTGFPSRGPRVADALVAFLRRLDRLMNWLWGARLNPLYRSGALATGLLLIVVVTGFYLLIEYRLGAPWESVRALREQWYLGGWIRGLHRYASDAAVVAVLFHVVRMYAEGKTWGARVLAWLSGVLLGLFMLVCGWTGYVMVWDTQGRELAVAGAQVLDLIPFFAEPIERTFRGGQVLGSSFFFLNLLVHFGLPLGMVMALWVHTARLARSVFLPANRELWLITGALTLLALLLPAPLGEQASPLALGGTMPIDAFYSFWLPVHPRVGPAVGLWVAALCVVGLSLAPLYWRPRAARKPAPSKDDEESCEGCEQCVKDCPAEAISMVPRTLGTGSALVARVDPSACVSCGICAGSCTRMSIGPPDRTGQAQMAWVKDLRLSTPEGGLVLVECGSTPTPLSAHPRLQGLTLEVHAHTLECTGQLHPAAVAALQKHFAGVVVVGCPPNACPMREGHAVMVDRLLNGRGPTLPGQLDLARLCVLDHTKVRERELLDELLAFVDRLGGRAATAPAGNRALLWAVRGGSVALMLAALALGSMMTVAYGVPGPALRLSFRVIAPQEKTCRTLSDAELLSRPVHMRQPQQCEVTTHPVKYAVSVDGQRLVEGVAETRGTGGQTTIFVDRDAAVPAGAHRVEATLEAQGGPEAGQVHSHAFDATFVTGKAVLLTWDRAVGGFAHTLPAP